MANLRHQKRAAILTKVITEVSKTATTSLDEARTNAGHIEFCIKLPAWNESAGPRCTLPFRFARNLQVYPHSNDHGFLFPMVTTIPIFILPGDLNPGPVYRGSLSEDLQPGITFPAQCQSIQIKKPSRAYKCWHSQSTPVH